MNRTKPSSKPKKSVGLSFAGDRGYEAFKSLEKHKDAVPTGKSGLVIELLIAYDKLTQRFGEDKALYQLSKMANEGKVDN